MSRHLDTETPPGGVVTSLSSLEHSSSLLLYSEKMSLVSDLTLLTNHQSINHVAVNTEHLTALLTDLHLTSGCFQHSDSTAGVVTSAGTFQISHRQVCVVSQDLFFGNSISPFNVALLDLICSLLISVPED